MHAWINITHPGFSGRQDMPDDGDQWVSWEQMVATMRAKGEAEGRAALLAREVVELRGEVAALREVRAAVLASIHGQQGQGGKFHLTMRLGDALDASHIPPVLRANQGANNAN